MWLFVLLRILSVKSEEGLRAWVRGEMLYMGSLKGNVKVKRYTEKLEQMWTSSSAKFRKNHSFVSLWQPPKAFSKMSKLCQTQKSVERQKKRTCPASPLLPWASIRCVMSIKSKEALESLALIELMTPGAKSSSFHFNVVKCEFVSTNLIRSN